MDTIDTKQTALGAVDPEVAGRLLGRRDAMKRGAALSGAAAFALRAASVPVALAALSRNAFGQRLPGTVVGVLNFALTLEYLEAEFYVRGVAADGLIPFADRAIFTTIRDHETAHVDFLRSALGAAARPKPTFDFTAGNGSGSGPYADVFSNYATFMAVAQAFEDTGVRAYKGQAPVLLPYDDVLTAALTIHSVEARHASEVRRLRGSYMDEEPLHQGWITLERTDVPGAEAVYEGEANTTHAGVDVRTLPSLSGIDVTELTEAWDEPLTMAQVLAIVDPFIA